MVIILLRCMLTELTLVELPEPSASAQCDAYNVSKGELQEVLRKGDQEMHIYLLDTFETNQRRCIMLTLPNTVARELMGMKTLLTTAIPGYDDTVHCDAYSISKAELLQELDRRNSEAEMQIHLLDTFNANERRSIMIILPNTVARRLMGSRGPLTQNLEH